MRVRHDAFAVMLKAPGAPRTACVVAIVLSLLGRPHVALGQDALAHRHTTCWVAGAILAASVIADEPLRRFAASHRSGSLDRIADGIDPLGRARYLVPALVAAAVLPRFFGEKRFANAALHVGIAYAAADLSGGMLRVLVARHRPDSTGAPWQFRPFRPQDQWGSMPSAHVTHAFAIAAAVAEESQSPWVARASFGLATLVALQRIYLQQHWTSDVVAGAALSTYVSQTIVRLRF